MNKNLILGLTSVLILLSLFYISFSFVSYGVEEDAKEFATNSEGILDQQKKQAYLDSMYTQEVYDLGVASFTLKEVKDLELKRGLDLQGGMHVTLEISPIEIIKNLAGTVPDSAFYQALDMASEQQKTSNKSFVDLFYENFKSLRPNSRLAPLYISTSTKDRISVDSPDEEVLKLIKEEVNKAVDRSFNIIRTRIDKFGVTQPNIQKLEASGRIQIELPGVDNPERVRNLVSGLAKLEFYEVYNGSEFFPYVNKANEVLYEIEQAQKAEDDSLSGESEDVEEALQPDEENKDNEAELLEGLEEVDEPEQLPEVEDEEINLTEGLDDKETEIKPADTGIQNADTSLASGEVDTALIADSDTSDLEADPDSAENVSELLRLNRFLYERQQDLIYEAKDTARVNEILSMPRIANIFPSNLIFRWSKDVMEAENGMRFITLYALRTERAGRPSVSGELVIDARQDISPDGRGYMVNLKFNTLGGKKFQQLTGTIAQRPKPAPEMANGRVAIVLDELVFSAPGVREEIGGGSCVIEGLETIEEAKDLENILKAGRLPAPTRIVEEAIVGPTLGKEAIQSGLTSVVSGLIIVILFMVAYYNRGGLVANLALLINLFFIFGILAQLGASLTLPGIAGIVLTIGMSIDANVLIFERIKEELRIGRPLINAIKNGYGKAYSSIIDSNATTFIVALFLNIFGQGPVKGFAVTLMIGIACSFFSAVFITRVVVEFMVRKKKDKSNISFDTVISKALFKGRDLINIVASRKIAYVVSSIIIIAGLASIFFGKGLNLGVDFQGGRSYVVRFDEPVSAVQIKKDLAPSFENSGTEVKTYDASNQVKVTTSYLVNDESREADDNVKEALFSGLQSYENLNPTVMSSSKVGATIADDIKNSSVIALLLSLAAIFIYIFVRFKKFQYSLGALAALFHDVLFVLGIISLAGFIGLQYEIDQVFIAAILTVIGYSINDTVVVFDRLRETITESPRMSVKEQLNQSINRTLSRTLMTSFTTLIVISILFVFGGEVLRGFSFTLLIGVLVGTYSSIFIAVPTVYDTSLKKLETKE